MCERKLIATTCVFLPLGTLALFGGILAYMLYMGFTSRNDQTNMCPLRLRSLYFALDEYSKTHGHLPSLTENPSGQGPEVTWRVKLLPHLGMKSVADQYDYNSKWSTPANLSLSRMVAGNVEFGCAMTNNELTPMAQFLAVDVEGAALRKTNSLTRLRDDSPNTIIVVYCSGSDICWMEPRDLNGNGLMGYGKESDLGWFRNHHRGNYDVLFADGEVWTIDEMCPLVLLSSFWRTESANQLNRDTVLGRYLLNRWN